ncbi:MAG: VWA-like domain-containing protein [Saprospiraceae bacterium]
MWRSGADITIIESDTKVYRDYPYKGTTPELVYGRGGTDFNDAIRWGNRFRPDALIYFTDGYAATPEVPLRMPVLWVISARVLSRGRRVGENCPDARSKLGKIQ